LSKVASKDDEGTAAAVAEGERDGEGGFATLKDSVFAVEDDGEDEGGGNVADKVCEYIYNL